MRAQSIHQHRALAYQPLPTSVHQHGGLLFSRFARHEALRRPYNRHQTARQSTEERQNLRPSKLLAQNRPPRCIDPVYLENMLRQI
jgi:hypothetical protein